MPGGKSKMSKKLKVVIVGVFLAVLLCAGLGVFLFSNKPVNSEEKVFNITVKAENY